MDNQTHFSDREGKRVTLPKRRRNYKKRGRQGRRTKLTGELLHAISEIVDVMEILSISHLSKELIARGYSLSRSTVFRAMEALGLKVDRHRKIWCAGPIGDDGDNHESTSNGPTNSRRDTQLSQSPKGVSDAEPKLFCEPTQDDQTRLSNLKTPWQLERPPSTSHLYRRHLTDTDLVRDAPDASRRPSGSRGDVPWKTSVEAIASRPGQGARNGQHARLARVIVTGRSTQLASQTNNLKRDIVGLEIATNKANAEYQEVGTMESNAVQSSSPPLTVAWVGSQRELGQASGIISASSSGNSEKRSRKRKSDCPAKLAAFDEADKAIPLPTTAASPADTGQSLFKGHEQVREAFGPSISSQAKNHPSIINSPSNMSKGELSLSPGSDGREPLEHNRLQNACRVEQRSEASYGMDRRQITLTNKGETQRGMVEPLQSENIPNAASMLDRHKAMKSTILRGSVPQGRMYQDHPDLLTAMRRKRDNDSQSTRSFSDANESDVAPRHNLEQGRLCLHSTDTQPLETLTSARPDRDLLEWNVQGEADPQRARLHALTSNLAAKTWANVRQVPSLSKHQDGRGNEDAYHLGRVLSNSEAVHSYPLHQSTSNAQIDGTGSHDFETRLTTAEGSWTRSGGRHKIVKSSPPTGKMNGVKHPLHSSGEYVLSCNDASDDDDNTPSSSGFSPNNMPELRHWMQDVSQKLTSMDRQLQYLTQIIVSATGIVVGTKVDNEQQTAPSAEPNTSVDPEEKYEGSEGDGKEGVEEEEGGSTMGTWGECLPPINTPQSNEIISRLLEDGPWDSLSPFIGGPRLAIRLARDCIFGPEVLSRSTVTGRNGMYPLHRDGVKKIKECLMEQYSSKCTEGECEMLWKMTRESLSQLCKRIRRQLTTGDNEQETDSQDDT